MKRKGPYASTPVVVKGLLFCGSNRGHLSCLDVATGEVLWCERFSKGKGIFAAVVAGDDRILFCDRSGEVTTMAPGRNPYNSLDLFNFRAEIYASPAVADGRLYIREEWYLWCFEE
jgi:hypothetical protein